jgi:hypothetical protein
MRRKVMWLLIVVAVMVAASLAIDLAFKAPSHRSAAITTYTNRRFQFSLAWDTGQFTVRTVDPLASEPSDAQLLWIDGVGRVRGGRGRLLMLQVALRTPADLPVQLRGLVGVTVARLDGLVKTPTLAAFRREPFMHDDISAGWVTSGPVVSDLNGTPAFRYSERVGKRSALDYVVYHHVLNGTFVYALDLTASSARWNAVQSRLDAVAQTLATGRVMRP